MWRVIIAALLLSGCAEHFAAQDKASCLEMGFQENTPEYRDCRMTLHQSRGGLVAGMSGYGGAGKSSQEESAPRSWMMNQGGRSYLCNNYGGTVNCN